MFDGIDDVFRWFMVCIYIIAFSALSYFGIAIRDTIVIGQIKDSCRSIGYYYINENESIKCEVINR